MIQFFDTFSGALKPFQTEQGKEVKLYTCGPTVYDYAHIGNFRTFVFEDLLRRFLEFKRYKVQHVMNITDVDDKTIAGANREGKKLGEFTSRYLEAFNEDLKTLNILPPHKQPHATEEIPAMIELIGKLVRNEKAYVSDGSVYYRVSAFPAYGKLSKKDLKGNIKGARVDVDEYEKEEGSDFALWKKAKEGEPSWDSLWGKGRPGWHIECSAMSMKYLGETFDIHAGGEDLIFPHHENEIAQSEGATGKSFVRYWLHAKHLLVNGEKMSKSKGNFYTLRDLIAKGYDPMAIRYALLSVHYRQQMNFTLDGLKEASEVIKRLDDCYFECLSAVSDKNAENSFDKKRDGDNAYLELRLGEMVMMLDDDLNVSKALASLFESLKMINRFVNQYQIERTGITQIYSALTFFKKIDKLFGFDIASIEKIPNQINAKLMQHFECRRSKNFSESDRIRKELTAIGWLVKDGRPGEPSTVKRKRRAWD